MRNKPEYWFFYARKTPEEFSEWVTTHIPPGDTLHMNDLKGQDQSTQGWAVRFFENLLRWFSFPEEWISSFRIEKLSKEINHKILAIMTDSGEVWTYLINTTSATARECLMYELQPGDPMANGGDDTVRRTVGQVGLRYTQVQHLDPCTDKRFESETGEFCSFLIRKGVLAKDPVILLKRFLGKLSMGAGEDAVLGYAHLWSMNYLLAERLSDIFTEEELTAHQLLTRIMMNLRKEGLKTKVDWEHLGLRGELQETPKYELIMGDTSPYDRIATTATSTSTLTSTYFTSENFNAATAALYGS